VDGVTTNTFDASDPLTDRGTTTYGYDSLNRLTSITGGTSYTYNGDGLRTKKVVGGVTTNFTWDPTGIGTVIYDGDSYL
jgi:hypothetical protein